MYSSYRRPTRYSSQDKSYYMRLCLEYNKASETLEGFVEASLRLHAAKANVPLKWARPSFIRSIGA